MISLSFAAAFAAVASGQAQTAQRPVSNQDQDNTITIQCPTNGPTVKSRFGSGLKLWVSQGTSVKVVVENVNTLLYDVQFSEEGIPSPVIPSALTSSFAQRRDQLLTSWTNATKTEQKPSEPVPAVPGSPSTLDKTHVVPTSKADPGKMANSMNSAAEASKAGAHSFADVPADAEPVAIAAFVGGQLKRSNDAVAAAWKDLKTAQTGLSTAVGTEQQCRGKFNQLVQDFNRTATRLGQDGSKLLGDFQTAVSSELHGADPTKVRSRADKAARRWLSLGSAGEVAFPIRIEDDLAQLDKTFTDLTEKWTECRNAATAVAQARGALEAANKAWLEATEFALTTYTLVEDLVREGHLKVQGMGPDAYGPWRASFVSVDVPHAVQAVKQSQQDVAAFVTEALRVGSASSDDIDQVYAEIKKRVDSVRLSRADLIANATNLQNAYDTIMAATFTASDTFRTVSGGGKKIHVVVKPSKNAFATEEIRDQLKEVSFTVELRTYGHWEMDTSTGYFFSSLTDQKYELRGGNVQVSETRDDYDQSLGLLIHMYRRPKGENTLAWSFGIVPAGSNRLQYLLGASYMFLAERRAVLTFGVTGGPVDSLRPGFRVGEPPPVEGAMTQSRFRFGWFFGISYNLG